MISLPMVLKNDWRTIAFVGRVVDDAGKRSFSPLSLPVLMVILGVFFEELIEFVRVFCKELGDFRF